MDKSGVYRKKWKEAMIADDCAISEYARDQPDTEDFAETMECFLAVTFRSERISETLRAKIEDTIPHRLKLLREVAAKEGWRRM